MDMLKIQTSGNSTVNVISSRITWSASCRPRGSFRSSLPRRRVLARQPTSDRRGMSAMAVIGRSSSGSRGSVRIALRRFRQAVRDQGHEQEQEEQVDGERRRDAQQLAVDGEAVRLA